MPEKRTVRARPSLFRKTDAGVPELEQPDSGLAERPAGEPGEPQDVPLVNHQDGTGAEPPASLPADQPAGAPARPPRIKATFYLTADDIVAIDTMQTEAFKRTGKKPERSELVSRAIQALFQRRDLPAS